MSALASRAGQNRILMIFIGTSLALHVAFVVVVAVTLSWGKKPPAPPPAIKTRLVKLGKQRDEKLLPRIEKKAPPPPSKKSPPDVQKDKKTKEPTPKKEPDKEPTPSAMDVLNKFKEKHADEQDQPSLSDLIAERTKTTDEGHEQGSKIGTEVSGRLRATYNDEILAKMQSNLEVPNTLSDEERVRLKARVFLRIDGDGSLLSSKVTRKSGNPTFDNAVLATVKKSAPFSAPPLTERDFYRNGVSVNLCPSSCR